MNQNDSEIIKKLIYYDGQSRNGYSSSSKELSDKLSALGIALPVKLHYDYKLPGGMAPQDYEKFLDELLFYVDFLDGDFDNPHLLAHIPELNKMTQDEKKALMRKIFRKQSQAKLKLKTEIEKIKKLNKEVAQIDTSKRPGSFLRGISYGFAPKDIDWFINKSETSLISNNANIYDELEKRLGFAPQYDLCSEHLNILLTAARTYRGKPLPGKEDGHDW